MVQDGVTDIPDNIKNWIKLTILNKYFYLLHYKKGYGLHSDPDRKRPILSGYNPKRLRWLESDLGPVPGKAELYCLDCTGVRRPQRSQQILKHVETRGMWHESDGARRLAHQEMYQSFVVVILIFIGFINKSNRDFRQAHKWILTMPFRQLDMRKFSRWAK